MSFDIHRLNEEARESIVRVSRRTGLREPVVYELLQRGWTFTESIDGTLSWHRNDAQDFRVDMIPLPIQFNIN